MKYKYELTQHFESLLVCDFPTVFTEAQYTRKCVDNFDLGLIDRKCDLVQPK